MAAFCRQIFGVTHMLLGRNKKDGRVIMVFILTAILLVRYLFGICQFGLEYDMVTTPFLLPVLFADATVSNGLVKILLYLAVLCLFCEAPFWEPWGRNVLVRCSKVAWWLGICLFMWIVSVVYLLFLAVGAALVVSLVASLSDLWGGVLRTFVESPMETADYSGNLVIPGEIIQLILPSAAEFLTFIAAWLSFVLIGHIVCFFNVLTNKKTIGMIAAALVIMTDPVVRYFGFSKKYQFLYLFSPISWSSIENWTILGYGHPISPVYTLGMYVALIAVLGILIVLVGARREVV